jgi:hypothetical protein
MIAALDAVGEGQPAPDAVAVKVRALGSEDEALYEALRRPDG